MFYTMRAGFLAHTLRRGGWGKREEEGGRVLRLCVAVVVCRHGALRVFTKQAEREKEGVILSKE